MDGIENLETVEAAQNKFTSAQGFRNMPKLKKIVLAQNQLASFPGISGTPSLEEVDVQQNSIAQTLQQAGVENYPTLKRMFFHKNNISGYDDGSQTYNIAGKMQSLSEINLRDNPYLFRKVNMDLGWMQFLPNTDPM
jgi:Leucine-rich repeat (LRR) protein